MNRKTFSIVNVSLSVAIIILLALSNIQLFFLSEQLDEHGEKSPTAVASNTSIVSSESNKVSQSNTQSDVNLANSYPKRSLDTALSARTTIDDFVNADLWNGGTPLDSGSIKLQSTGKMAEAYRKYDGFLSLSNYITLNADFNGIENLDWIALFLLEDMSYANYYEFDLKPHITNGANTIVINRKNAKIGTGKPDWNKISSVKLAFQTKEGASADITLHEISTYDATPMCTIWFDDGWKSTYTEAFRILEDNNIPGTLSVISSHVGYPDFCSLGELKDMYDAGWDLVNHTQSHKNLSEISSEEAEKEISICLNYLNDNGFTRASDHFVPPYCATNEKVEEIISKYAVTSRPQWNAYNELPIIDPYKMCFREVLPHVKPETVYQWIDESIENDLWLVLLFHSLETPADTNTKYAVEDFQRIVDRLAEVQSEIPCVTVSEAMQLDVVKPIEKPSVLEDSDESQWSLVWEDSFDDNKLNTDYWNAVEAAPFKNNELQTYTKDHVDEANGFLNLVSSFQNNEYLSGAVTTNNKQLFRYGRIDVKAKLPRGKGIFPAIWLLPQSDASFPEIDIIEFLGSKPNEIWHVMHYEQNGERNRAFHKVTADDFSSDFHVFSLEWTEQSMTWLIDGKITYTVDSYVPSEKMYLYINTAVGGNWPGNPNKDTEFPQTMQIDYVKYYTKKV